MAELYLLLLHSGDSIVSARCLGWCLTLTMTGMGEKKDKFQTQSAFTGLVLLLKKLNLLRETPADEPPLPG